MTRPPYSELIAKTRRMDEILRALNHPFAFMGGIALNVWTVPAPTYDIDICVAVPEEELPALRTALDRAGFLMPATSWIESVGSAGFKEMTVSWPFQEGLIPADIFLAWDPFQKEALVRRREVELDDGFRTWVVSAEDLLIYKLVAWRRKDQAAAENLLALQENLDRKHIDRWCGHFRVADRLRELLNDGERG